MFLRLRGQGLCRDKPNWKTNVGTREGFRGERACGICWPLDIHNTYHQDEELHVDAIITYNYKGEDLKGVVKEDDGKPLPIGCVRLIDYSGSEMSNMSCVERADEVFSEGQAENTLVFFCDQTRWTDPQTAQALVEPGGKAKSKPRGKKRMRVKAKEGSSEPEDDDDPDFLGFALHKPPAKLPSAPPSLPE